MKQIFLSLCLMLLCTAGCSKQERGQRLLRIALGANMSSLDPRRSSEVYSVIMTRMLYEGLMRVEPDGTVVPAVAQEVSVSADQKTYTFRLRNTKWSNGDPVTTYDFAYAWKTSLNVDLGSPNMYHFYCIKNARAVAQKEIPMEELGIEVIDAKTLIVHLEHPTPYFLEMLALPYFFPVHHQIDQKHQGWARRLSKHFVSNGPFVLKKWKENEELTLLRNPLYWDQEHVKLEGISILIMPDQMTQLHLFEIGKLDWYGAPFIIPHPETLAKLKAMGKLEYAVAQGVAQYYLNTESPPFTNKKIRQAFACAVNRRTLTEHLLEGGETPARSVLPGALQLQKEPYFPDGDLARARALFEEGLEELGMKKEELPPISLSYSITSPVAHQVAQVVQVQWHEAFGIWVQLQRQEWKVHYANMQMGKFQIGAMGWHAWIRDPIYNLSVYKYRKDRLNISRWENGRYQQLLDASDQEINPAKRRALLHEAEQILMDAMPVIPLFFSTNPYVKNPQLRGVYSSECTGADFRWASFEER